MGKTRAAPTRDHLFLRIPNLAIVKVWSLGEQGNLGNLLPFFVPKTATVVLQHEASIFRTPREPIPPFLIETGCSVKRLTRFCQLCLAFFAQMPQKPGFQSRTQTAHGGAITSSDRLAHPTGRCQP